MQCNDITQRSDNKLHAYALTCYKNMSNENPAEYQYINYVESEDYIRFMQHKKIAAQTTHICSTLFTTFHSITTSNSRTEIRSKKSNATSHKNKLGLNCYQ